MKHRIKRVSVHQTSMVFAALYACLGFFAIPLGIVMFGTESGWASWTALFMPVFHAAGGYLLTALSCAIYNVAARVLGGIEVHIEGV